MSLENVIYLLSEPWYQFFICLLGVMLFTLKFGGKIYTWYQFKYQDFGTCRRCLGKLDSPWYLVCTKCYAKQMSMNNTSGVSEK